MKVFVKWVNFKVWRVVILLIQLCQLDRSDSIHVAQFLVVREFYGILRPMALPIWYRFSSYFLHSFRPIPIRKDGRFSSVPIPLHPISLHPPGEEGLIDLASEGNYTPACVIPPQPEIRKCSRNSCSLALTSVQNVYLQKLLITWPKWGIQQIKHNLHWVV